jgi:endoglucanase
VRDYHNSSGYHDELVWGALWLYKATGEAGYLGKAESIYREHFANAPMRWTHSWDDKQYGAVIILAQLTKSDTYKQAVRRQI